MKDLAVWLFDFVCGLLSKRDMASVAPGADLSEAATGSIAITATGGQTRDEADNQIRATMVAFMAANVGDRYEYGGVIRDDEQDPKSGDCSEYMMAAYHRGGLTYPDGCVYQKEFMRGRKVAEPKPGDVFFFGPNKNGIPHTGMYVGNGECIHALGGKGVVRQPTSVIESHPRFEGWWRHPNLGWPKEDRA